MGPYIEPIRISLITFPLFAFLLAIPFAIYNYKKYGFVNKWRTFVLFSLILYLLTAYYLVILPLPQTRDIKSIQRPGTVHYNLRPFQFIREIVKETRVDWTNPKTYKLLLRERAFLQAAFNLLLVLPFGVYLRYYFKKGLKETLFYSFLLSSFFELTQLSGLYGIYNAPYRLFDVDDLFLNTLGGGLGYFIAPVFEFFFPKMDELDQKYRDRGISVGYIRRFIGFFIDTRLVGILSRLVFNKEMSFLVFLGYFTVFQLITKGKTLGYYLTNIRLRGEGDRLGIREILKRNIAIYISFYGARGLYNLFNKIVAYANISSKQANFYQGILFFITAGITIFIFINMLYSMIKKDRFFYEKYSKTYLAIDSGKDRKGS